MVKKRRRHSAAYKFRVALESQVRWFGHPQSGSTNVNSI